LVSTIIAHFWYGKSNGTKFTIYCTKKIGKAVEVYIVE